MLLSVDDMVKLLRSSVNVAIPSEDEQGNPILVTDNAYLVMTDDDIKLFIKLGVTRAFPDVEDLSELPDGSEFAIVLLAKIELYTKLAVTFADKVDMGADNNNYLKQSQKFEHYMKLIDGAKSQYDDWLENESEGANSVKTYDVLLSKRHYSLRNYEKQQAPKVRIRVDELTSDYVCFHWTVSNCSHFSRFKVYFSETPIIDMYRDGARYADKISDKALCIKSTGDFRDTTHKVTSLDPNTVYYIAVVSIERNQVFGYTQISFTTLEEVSEEEDIDITNLNP